MKQYVKGIVFGFLIGTLGVTTVFAANGIQSAHLSSAKVTLDGAPVPLSNPLVSVTKDGEESASLYMPVGELLEQLGYTVNWDGTNDTIHIVSKVNDARGGETAVTDGTAVIQLSSRNAFNIAESGSFQADNNQVLALTITSNIQGGTVHLFLLDPDGKEQQITIGSANAAKEIPLSKGVWQYNCSGMFKDGGNIEIVGIIKEGN